MTPLQRHWLFLSKKHGLEVDVPFTLHLTSGAEIAAEVRLRGYGAENGMLLVSDDSAVWKHREEIVAMGFGFSCLSQPSEKEIESDEGLDELLNDWGKL